MTELYYTSNSDGGYNVIDVNKISDGYHTFPELYEYRMLYNAALFNEWAKVDYWTAQPAIEVHKSWKHSDGELCFGGGFFIVVAQLPTGQISNHYKEQFWDLFKIPEKEIPNEYDGHTSAEAASRLGIFLEGLE